MSVRILIIILMAMSFQVIADNRSSLSGQWEWLPDESDDPGRLIAKGLEYLDVAAFQVARSSGRTVPVGAFRRKPSEKQVDTLVGFFDAIVPLGPLASIEHREPWMKLGYADGREREIYTDGRDLAASVQTTAAQQAQKIQFASWEGATLVVETNTTSGVSVLERYSLEAHAEKDEARLLRVEVIIDSARLAEKISFNSVYRSAGER
ncbi:MAG TPA: hypothetical protein VF268_04675 [Gammaproteobacteria bacterium]